MSASRRHTRRRSWSRGLELGRKLVASMEQEYRSNGAIQKAYELEREVGLEVVGGAVGYQNTGRGGGGHFLEWRCCGGLSFWGDSISLYIEGLCITCRLIDGSNIEMSLPDKEQQPSSTSYKCSVESGPKTDSPTRAQTRRMSCSLCSPCSRQQWPPRLRCSDDSMLPLAFSYSTMAKVIKLPVQPPTIGHMETGVSVYTYP
ncbi:hypothetical protein CC80DRAFT_3967 [Byssothecium circinans]|uniref:Uncharacterized protein n=1 Tax=Byssothecium circinans TaxID=147558 RepID=A0A6A5UHC9_9PLEO|nr:hypothetical protein CC80DRAFT_3967 [Byssothecium circinans]